MMGQRRTGRQIEPRKRSPALKVADGVFPPVDDARHSAEVNCEQAISGSLTITKDIIMADEPKTEVRNKERVILGTEKNDDGTPVQEVVEDGKPVAEIRNKERVILGTEKNDDGTPVKEIIPKK